MSEECNIKKYCNILIPRFDSCDNIVLLQGFINALLDFLPDARITLLVREGYDQLKEMFPERLDWKTVPVDPLRDVPDVTKADLLLEALEADTYDLLLTTTYHRTWPDDLIAVALPSARRVALGEPHDMPEDLIKVLPALGIESPSCPYDEVVVVEENIHERQKYQIFWEHLTQKKALLASPALVEEKVRSHQLSALLKKIACDSSELQTLRKEVQTLKEEIEHIHKDGFRWLLAMSTQTQELNVFEWRYPAQTNLISVIIPAYNAKSFLERAVRSVWEQQLEHYSIEILICEDGSDDGTYELARNLQSQSPVPLQVLTHPGRINRGVSATRNLGLHHAHGAYIALLDADDVWHPTRLAVQMDYLEQHPDVQSVCSLGYNRDLQGKLVKGWNYTTIAGDYRHVEPPNNFQSPYTFEQLLNGYPIINSTLLIRRDAITYVGGYPDIMAHQCEDWLLVAKLSLQAPIPLIEQPLIDYTVHPNSYTYQQCFPLGVGQDNPVGLTYGVELEFLFHLVHWMVHHPEHQLLGEQVFRRYYPRFLILHGAAYRLCEEYYRWQNDTDMGVQNFKAYLNRVHAELEELRRYYYWIPWVKRIPGIVPVFLAMSKLKKLIGRLWISK